MVEKLLRFSYLASPKILCKRAAEPCPKGAYRGSLRTLTGHRSGSKIARLSESHSLPFTADSLKVSKTKKENIGRSPRMELSALVDMEGGPCRSEVKASPLVGMRWFAVQAHSRAEAAAEFGLRSLSIETLLPLVCRPLHHATRAARQAVRALFPGYLFARFCIAESLRAVTYSRGVVRVVGAGGRPIPVEDAIIASIRARIGEDGCVALDERRLSVRDCVRIISGPLAGWSGVFERELSDLQRVVILIETLQQGRVVISRDLLELSDAA